MTYWGDPYGPKVINLQCGYHDAASNTGQGWHHIQAGHESQWQDRISQIPGGTGNWDDLMAFAAAQAIENPIVDIPRGSNSTRCVSVPILMYDNDGDYLYTLNPSVAFGSNTLRVITAIPTTTASC